MKRLVLIALLLMMTATPALAHVGILTKETAPGTFYKGILTVPHGCDGSATTRVTVTIPEGMIAVKPMPKAGWTVTYTKGEYANTYDFMHGKQLSGGIVTITWTGNLADEFYDEFVFSSYIAKTAQGTLYFPVVQECEQSVAKWIQIPAAGQSAHDLESPAPALTLNAAASSSSAFRAGSLTVESPWLRETSPSANVAGGFMKIVNNGTAPDRLVGGTIEGAGGFEIHEMSMTDGIMRMRPLPDGLVLKAGETVELAPGGYHLMGTGMKTKLTAGQTVKGTLEFEKAGKLDLAYEVRPLSGTEQQHHGH